QVRAVDRRGDADLHHFLFIDMRGQKQGIVLGVVSKSSHRIWKSVARARYRSGKAECPLIDQITLLQKRQIRWICGEEGEGICRSDVRLRGHIASSINCRHREGI